MCAEVATYRLCVESPRRLDLQPLCTVGTPVRKYLGCWSPTLPIVINYRTHWNSLSSSAEDEDNIYAALDHPSRVCSIELVAASSFINEILGLMQRQFPALTNLRLSSPDSGVLVSIMSRISWVDILVYYAEFRSRQYYQTFFCLSGTSSSFNFWRYWVPPTISPEAVVAGLSNLSRLKTLEIGYSSLRSCTITGTHPPPPILSALSTLNEFRFKGSCEYLEDLVARLDILSLQECCTIA